jgi:hypothetical protein
MSNYRVRQVLALPKKPERQLRLLAAIATFLSDDTCEVEAGLPAVVKASGLSRRHAKIARDELTKAGDLAYKPGLGAGNHTLWTVLCLPETGDSCLPEKGHPIGAPFMQGAPKTGKGAPTGREKGHPAGKKRGTRKSSDQGKRDHWLEPLASTSGSSPVVDAGEKSTGSSPGPQAGAGRQRYRSQEWLIADVHQHYRNGGMPICDGDADAVAAWIGDDRNRLAKLHLADGQSPRIARDLLRDLWRAVFPGRSPP